MKTGDYDCFDKNTFSFRGTSESETNRKITINVALCNWMIPGKCATKSEIIAYKERLLLDMVIKESYVDFEEFERSPVQSFPMKVDKIEFGNIVDNTLTYDMKL
jgi:hypothetical protein